MRNWLCALLFLPLAALAEEIDLPIAGLHIKLPDEWTRDRSLESRDTPLYATLDADDEGDKQIMIRITGKRAVQFDADKWMDEEKKARTEFFETVTNKFKRLTKQEFGGRGSIGYSMAGVGLRDADDEEEEAESIEIQFQVFAVINGSFVWEVELVSYKGAHLDKPEAVEGMLNAITFPKPRYPPLDLSAPADAAASEVTDEKGNIKLKLPAGWALTADPSDNEDSIDRFELERTSAQGLVICRVKVLRYTPGGPALFDQESPSSVMPIINRDTNFFENIYGHKDLEFDVNESNLLGGAEKSASYVIKNRTKTEWAAIHKLQKQIDKGLKLSLPDPPQIVVRGRIAMISPYIYVTRVVTAPGRGEDPALVADLKALHEGFEFLSSKAKMPPLRVFETKLGNTLDDPANAKPKKKQKIRCEAFSIKQKRTEPSAILLITYTLPKGFVRSTSPEIDKRKELRLVLAAQDKNNTSVLILLVASHWSELPVRNNLGSQSHAVPKLLFEQWRSSWENAARGTGKLREKPLKTSVGGLKAKAMEFSGLRDGFPGTRRNYMIEKWGWRLEVQADARGDGIAVFEKDIERFLKSIRLKKLKR